MAFFFFVYDFQVCCAFVMYSYDSWFYDSASGVRVSVGLGGRGWGEVLSWGVFLCYLFFISLLGLAYTTIPCATVWCNSLLPFFSYVNMVDGWVTRPTRGRVDKGDRHWGHMGWTVTDRILGKVGWDTKGSHRSWTCAYWKGEVTTNLARGFRYQSGSGSSQNG